jgi:hypothetical protein
MSEMGEYWRDVDAAMKEHRDENARVSLEVLAKMGVEYETNDGGNHLMLLFRRRRVADFWPRTRRWQIRAGRAGRGAFKLLESLALTGVSWPRPAEPAAPASAVASPPPAAPSGPPGS